MNYRHAKGGLVSVDVDGTVCRYTALGGWVPNGDLTPRALATFGGAAARDRVAAPAGVNASRLRLLQLRRNRTRSRKPLVPRRNSFRGDVLGARARAVRQTR